MTESRSVTKRVLVAGATGYLGGHVVAELKRRGVWVRALARRPEQAKALAGADEVFIGQVTRPASLTGVADGVDAVFSCLGITRPKDRAGYDQVDYAGNLALLREAERSGASQFGYVALHNGRLLRDKLAIAAAKERFVDVLRASGVQSTIVRPTGFFSDMASFADMAARGRIFLIGDGRTRMNPISGRDLANASLDAMAEGAAELDIGGPQVLTYEEIARRAAHAARPCRITHLPAGLVRGTAAVTRRTTPQRIWGPLQFFATIMTMDMVAPPHGTDTLADFFAARQATPIPHNGGLLAEPGAD